LDDCGASGLAARCAKAFWLLIAITSLAAPAWGAEPERDICERKTGPELIRCIEAAARSGGTPPATDAPRPASGRSASPHAVAPPSAPVLEAPRAPVQDCTGRSGEALRRCLAAGGRLDPQALGRAPSASPAMAAPPPAAGRSEGCDTKSGEALRLCVEAQAKEAAIAARKPSQPQVVPCTGYTSADQPLCVHRNTAIGECRNRSLYPDFDICLRSHMANAPQPMHADCSKLQARSRSHCEARNRVYASCSGDRLGYFACLERHLGSDAVLTRR
jgi:hypothetical protein